MTTEVVDGVVVSIDGDIGLSRPDPGTVEDLFDLVEASAEASDDCTIEWHPDLGYPMSAAFVRDHVIDGGWGIEVVALTPLDGES